MVSRHWIFYSHAIHAICFAVADRNVRVGERFRVETTQNQWRRSKTSGNQRRRISHSSYSPTQAPTRAGDLEEYFPSEVTLSQTLKPWQQQDPETRRHLSDRDGKRNRRRKKKEKPTYSPSVMSSNVDLTTYVPQGNEEELRNFTDHPSQSPSYPQLSDLPTFVPTWSPVPLLTSPLQVFVIAGQSNAMGKGSIQHLDSLIAQKCDGGCNEYRKALWDEHSNSYKVNSQVYEKSLHYHTGELAVYDDFYDDATNESDYYTFGPELMFGWTVQEDFGVPIAIIKTAWAGRSLAVDFRPPSSGMGNHTNVDPFDYGAYYRKMLLEITNSLADLESWVPSYNPSEGYELAGFVWFQGWNDLLNWNSVMEYADNLANLIRDLRYHLQVEHLPFVVGELGMHGDNESLIPPDAYARIMKMRSSQYLVTTMDEFKDDTLFVRTAPYVVLNGEQYNGVYHYGGRADTFFHIGQAFGRGMLTLLGRNATESGDCQCESEVQ